MACRRASRSTRAKQRIEQIRDDEDLNFIETNPFAAPDTDPRGPPPQMGGLSGGRHGAEAAATARNDAAAGTGTAEHASAQSAAGLCAVAKKHNKRSAAQRSI